VPTAPHTSTLGRKKARMADSFRCLLCGGTSDVEGKRSWPTVILSIVSFAWVFELWYRYCPTCMAKINAISVFLIAAIGFVVLGVSLYAFAR
jgi:hypothetical protein